MKKTILIFIVVTLVLIWCAKTGISPLSPEEDYKMSEEKPIHLRSISGTLIDHSDLVSIYPDDEASWIFICFDGAIDTSKTGIVVEETNGDEVQYDKEWNITSRETEFILKPADTLDYNTTYIIKVIASEVSDIKGNFLGKGDDNVGGERPDDYYIFAFTTFQSDGSPGDYAVNLEDIFHPWIASGIYFLIGDSLVLDIWTDVNVSIDIYDLNWNEADSSVVIVGADIKTIDETSVMLIFKDSGEEVGLSSVTYEDDTSATDFGRITVKPARHLKPGTTYNLRLLSSIADKAGNKLKKVGYIAYEESFTTLYCNHDSSECTDDVTAPSIESWINLKTAFEVEFREKVDRNTVTESTVYLEEGGVRIAGVLTIREERGHTIVRFTRNDGNSVFGATAFISSEIKDLSGNRKGSIESHVF